MANLIDTDLLTEFGTKFKIEYEKIFATETTKKYTIEAANWSDSKSTMGDSEYYTYVFTLSQESKGVPTVSQAPGSSTLPSEAEKEAFSVVRYATIDDADNKTMKLYAEEKPGSTFYLNVRSFRY